MENWYQHKVLSIYPKEGTFAELIDVVKGNGYIINFNSTITYISLRLEQALCPLWQLLIWLGERVMRSIPFIFLATVCPRISFDFRVACSADCSVLEICAALLNLLCFKTKLAVELISCRSLKTCACTSFEELNKFKWWKSGLFSKTRAKLVSYAFLFCWCGGGVD